MGHWQVHSSCNMAKCWHLNANICPSCVLFHFYSLSLVMCTSLKPTLIHINDMTLPGCLKQKCISFLISFIDQCNQHATSIVTKQCFMVASCLLLRCVIGTI